VIQLDTVVAIDVHVHAEASCVDPEDPVMGELFDAASSYFKVPRQRPSIQETIDYYRERRIAFCLFTVDCEAGIGARRIRNEEIAELANANADIVIPFASVDPHKGKLGAREARDLIENWGVRGFKFHPPMQDYDPSDRMAYPLYEVIAEYKLPAIFHTGHSGMGTGLKGGAGIKLKYGQPMLVDEVAADFPDIKFILAHPSWPWTDESLSMALHKANVYIDLSGWSPKYFPEQIVRYANSQLSHKMLFGSDFPLIRPDSWIEAASKIGFRDDVLQSITKGNAAKLLNLDASSAA
jgi:predicted TIM-barrel fold metal-dependent hydrolase